MNDISNTKIYAVEELEKLKETAEVIHIGKTTCFYVAKDFRGWGVFMMMRDGLTSKLGIYDSSKKAIAAFEEILEDIKDAKPLKEYIQGESYTGKNFSVYYEFDDATWKLFIKFNGGPKLLFEESAYRSAIKREFNKRVNDLTKKNF